MDSIEYVHEDHNVRATLRAGGRAHLSTADLLFQNAVIFWVLRHAPTYCSLWLRGSYSQFSRVIFQPKRPDGWQGITEAFKMGTATPHGAQLGGCKFTLFFSFQFMGLTY